MQILLERAAVWDEHELRERAFLVARQIDAALAREVEQRARTHRAVEMTMQLRLGETAQPLAIDRGHVTRRRRACGWRSFGRSIRPTRPRRRRSGARGCR